VGAVAVVGAGAFVVAGAVVVVGGGAVKIGVAVLLGDKVKLDEIEKTFCNRGFMGQEEAVLAVQLIPKLLKVAKAASHCNHLLNKWDLIRQRSYAHEDLSKALAELEQP
jgi:hypothetical protein